VSKLFKFWIPVLIWALVIFWFSSKTQPETSTVYWQEFAIKKTAHMVVYGILAILLFRAFRNYGANAKQAALYAILWSFVYGVSDEFHQSFTPGREPRFRDVIFDTIGATITTVTLWKLLPKAPKKLMNLARKLDLA
jgi:VanZ family protein